MVRFKLSMCKDLGTISAKLPGKVFQAQPKTTRSFFFLFNLKASMNYNIQTWGFLIR